MRFKKPRGAPAALLMVWSAAGGAAGLEFTPSLSAQREWNSNVFYVESHDDAAAQHGGDSTLRDVIDRYVAAIDAGYHWGVGERFHIMAEGRRVDFDHFNLLDHNEYEAGLGYDWQIGDRYSGKLQYTQERRMASLVDRDDFDLHMETERKGEADIYVRRTADWRYEIALRARDLVSPMGVTFAYLPDDPNTPIPLPPEPEFGLREEAASLGVHYQGTAHIDTGVSGEMLVGKYRNVPAITDVTAVPPTTGTVNPPSYLETTIQGFGIYEIKDFSKATGRLGLTLRGTDDSGYTSDTDLTGMLQYWRAFTSKSSADITVQRNVGSYAEGAASMVQTSGGVHLHWNSFDALRFDGGYDWGLAKFQGSEIVDPSLRGRRDIVRTASASLGYTFLRYFTLTPTYENQVRASNKPGRSYHDNVETVMLAFKW